MPDVRLGRHNPSLGGFIPNLFTAQPNIKQLVSVGENPDGSFGLSLPLGSSVGAVNAVEVQNPANGTAILTVPAGKTFSGLAVIVAQLGVSGSVAISAATGGVQARANASAATPAGRPTISIVPVTIAGGAGNAVTAVTSGTVVSSTVALVGHVA